MDVHQVGGGKKGADVLIPEEGENWKGAEHDSISKEESVKRRVGRGILGNGIR